MKESIKVLDECKELQLKKAQDYQNPHSSIKQADYYPNGCASILDIMHIKMLRLRSVLETMQHNPKHKQHFESLEDSAKDLINYASFFVEFYRGKMQGQPQNRDILNRRKNG
tara:strand:- start:1728 stop:2063 length:336 start_codon:yes stop_codon:yes gene_type:complete